MTAAATRGPDDSGSPAAADPFPAAGGSADHAPAANGSAGRISAANGSAGHVSAANGPADHAPAASGFAAATGDRPTIAVLGLGEAGSLIAADLAAAGAIVQGYDPEVPAPAGVRAADSDAAAVDGASIVLSVNSAADATDALRAALPALTAGTIWADLNTATPRLKERLAALGGQAARVVDVALMSPVPGRGLHTPMIASGPAAAELAAVLGGYGAAVEVLDGPVGAAATRKLLRSVFYKGMAAAVTEALEAARAAGLEEWLSGDIRDELVRSNAGTLDRLVDGSRKHAVRRREEMAAATELLSDLGIPPRIAPAARDVLEALARQQQTT
jgi:3-hydroxyisobutyrate dehydrogenase-like beta-hydroxyacid dehydrogenase